MWYSLSDTEDMKLILRDPLIGFYYRFQALLYCRYYLLPTHTCIIFILFFLRSRLIGNVVTDVIELASNKIIAFK